MENKPPDDQDELRAENALIRLKLEQEFGMQHTSEPMSDPKAENQWLRHIYNIESAIKTKRTISVYNLIGRPDFKHPIDLEPQEVEEELNRVLQLLKDQKIIVDTICEYEPIEVYRFIVDDLFPYETNDMPYSGTVTWFIYEEFYPNYEYDIENDCGDFVNHIFGNWSDYFFNIIVADEVLYNNKKFSKTEIEGILKVYAEAHLHIEIEEFTNVQISFDFETEQGSYSAQFWGYDSINKTECKASVHFGLEFDDNMWVINSIEFPDFDLGGDALDP